MLNRQCEDAEQTLVEKKKTRNVTGIAVATATISLFQNALTNLESSGSFVLPVTVRRELEPALSEVSSARKPIEAAFSNEMSRLEAECLGLFVSAVKSGRPALSDKMIETQFGAEFRSLLVAFPSAPESVAPGTNASSWTAGTTPAAGGATNAPPPPEFFAASGDAQQWLTVGYWNGAMRGVDVISIPVMQTAGVTNRTEQENAMTGKKSQLEYVSVFSLTPLPGLVYRLRRVRGQAPVDVLDWPSSRNAQQLVVRTTWSERFPCPHGFEIQAGIPTGDVRQATAAAAPPPSTDNAPRVLLSLGTTPTGASIVVDGKAITAAVTPCKLKLAAGTHAIRLSLPGYQDLWARNLDIQTNQAVQWTFTPDPRFARKTVSVPAAANRWVGAGITVGKGDTLVVYTEGKWSCATDRETIGPEGYPRDEKFAKYYSDPVQSPRQMPDNNYGALLMRIGEAQPSYVVGSRYKLVVPAPGAVSFDINEIQDPRVRKDNTGALTVTVIVMPPGTAPSP